SRGRGEGVDLTSELHKIPFGKGELLREGSDVLLLPVGNRVYPALQAAEGLLKIGISAAVINPRFINPLDGDLISEWAARTGKVVTVEDNVKKGGFGSAVLELLCKRGLTAIPVRLLGIPDRFIEHGSQEILRHNTKIDTPAIISSALELVGR
ncbi:MAG: 1-deoxy-D-xylulose-5-phosphate synthase, partial [Deltaproteobacteria bacterium]|nr:1-deoxy-D-xylulose-5-phosphate synthase [Deltaproteobacteria bacterium]